MTNEQASKFVDKALLELGDQFEAVQILVSWPDQAGTKNIYAGCGNWFARRGMAEDFLTIEEARDMAKFMKGEGDND